MRRLFTVWLVVVLAGLAGCVPRRSGDAVRTVRFDEEHRRPRKMLAGRVGSDAALRNAMAHPPPRWQSFVWPLSWMVEKTWLDRPLLDSDAWRIEIWYANHGYFDARFLGWDISARDPAGKEVRPVRVRGHIDPGEPSRVRSFELTGIEGLGGPLRARVLATVQVKEGDVFTTSAHTATVDGLRTLLHEKSYAYAAVTGDVVVNPAEHAVDVRVAVTTGPACRFGPVTFSFKGKRTVPEEIVRDYITIEEGKPYRSQALATTRSALFSLRTFSVVNVLPDLSDPSVQAVPIRIELSEGLSRQLKVGPGFEIETGKATGFGSIEWEDNNLLHRLWRLKGTTRAGVSSVLPEGGVAALLSAGAEVSPVVDATIGLVVPHLGSPDWSFQLDTHAEYGIEPGYRFFSPETSPSVSWRIRDRLTLSAGYRLKYFDYFDATIDVSSIENSPLGLDLTDPYLLSLLEQRAIYDGRNDPINTTRGWYWSLAVAEAGGPVLGNFQFFRVQGEARAYRSVVRILDWDPETVVAGRVGGGLIVPYGGGAEASVPYTERFYLGSGTTVRGWATNRLGPYVLVPDLDTCAVEGKPATCDTVAVPAGGLLSLYGNFEIRKGLWGGLSVAAFTDVGRVWDAPGNAAFDELQWSVGGGPRYTSPIGPVRLDFGFRLGDPEYFESQPRWTVHFGLSEAF